MNRRAFLASVPVAVVTAKMMTRIEPEPMAFGFEHAEGHAPRLLYLRNCVIEDGCIVARHGHNWTAPQ